MLRQARFRFERASYEQLATSKPLHSVHVQVERFIDCAAAVHVDADCMLKVDIESDAESAVLSADSPRR